MSRQMLSNRMRTGFTMIEMVLTLAIFSLLQIGLVQAMNFGIDYYEQLTQETDDDWANFILQVDREIRQATIKKINSHSVIYHVEGIGDVVIEYYHNQHGGMLRRRVRYSGHQPLLTHIESVKMTPESSNSFKMICDFHNGKQKQFVFYILLEGDRG